MNFEKELKKRETNIRTCSIQSDIPYATLYPIIKGRVNIGTCPYFMVAKLAKFLGCRPDEIVYEIKDFQAFRNKLHHRIQQNELELILETVEGDDVSKYMRHEDYLKALYLVASVDYLSKKTTSLFVINSMMFGRSDLTCLIMSEARRCWAQPRTGALTNS